MNESEFKNLPDGSEILETECDVVQRNALLSFATNASDTNLATLNQNKNGIYAIGLNKTGYGTDRHYTSFNDKEKMIPLTTAPPIYAKMDGPPAYEGLLEDFYGVDNGDAKFATSVPKHQVGMYTVLMNYFCLTQTNKFKGGWPNLQSKIREYDAAATVGEHILHYSYKPEISPIKKPLQYLPCQIPYGKNKYPHGTLQSTFEGMSTDNTTGKNMQFDYEHVSRAVSNVSYDLYTDIEKSQYMVRGIGGTLKPKIQPSLHVGINPVPALTTSSIISGDTNSNFTDTRSYFDITCKCTVGFRLHTDRPFAESYNCAAGEEIMVNNSNVPNHDSVPFAQLYGTGKIPEK